MESSRGMKAPQPWGTFVSLMRKQISTNFYFSIENFLFLPRNTFLRNHGKLDWFWFIFFLGKKYPRQMMKKLLWKMSLFQCFFAKRWGQFKIFYFENAHKAYSIFLGVIKQTMVGCCTTSKWHEFAHVCRSKNIGKMSHSTHQIHCEVPQKAGNKLKVIRKDEKCIK